MKVRGIRGATTANSNTKESIVEVTTELLTELVARNEIDADDVAAVTFTATPDLNAEFPAVAARLGLGWTNVALMCAQEMQVPDGQPRTIRVMILLNTDKDAAELENVYLRDAVDLRLRGSERERDRRSAN
ncbi:MAG: chorismate mutase [Dehalococcoidia bacterium]|nr:chorismate mutase [Dehalococcoidia bacterium]